MTKTKKQKRQYTTYAEATKDLKLILCNEVQNFELSDISFRFEDYVNKNIIKEINESGKYNTEEEKEEALKDKVIESVYSEDIYQYYLTDLYLQEVKYLTAKYGLKFAYCEELNLWVLLVTTFGICWEGVKVEVKDLKEY